MTAQINLKSEQFEAASPQDILSWASDAYGGKLAIVTSFQPAGVAALHMMQDIAPRTPVLTLDTGLLFPETHDLIDRLERRFKFGLKRVKPRQTLKQQARDYGDRLWERNPDRCCHLRKTMPLRDALVGFEAWVTGLRRDQSPSRADIPIVSADRRTGLVKIAPFANWSESRLWAYIHAHELPCNALHDIGYPSIGCWPCTKAVGQGQQARSGRWSSRSKTECGIHVEPADELAKESDCV